MFSIFVVTLGCKSDRIEENVVIESSLQVVIPIVNSSGIKCLHLSSTLSYRMRYGVNKLTLWVRFSKGRRFHINFIMVSFFVDLVDAVRGIR